MKNNQLTGMLLGLVLIGTLANAGLIYMYNSAFHQLQGLQSTVMAINTVQGLLNESVEYSKTHPDLAKVLQGGPATAPRPSAPSATNKSQSTK